MPNEIKEHFNQIRLRFGVASYNLKTCKPISVVIFQAVCLFMFLLYVIRLALVAVADAVTKSRKLHKNYFLLLLPIAL